MNKINEVISQYSEYETLYDELKQFYIVTEISFEEEAKVLNKIKKIIVDYYLNKYKFNKSSNDEIHELLLHNISKLCDLSKKIKYNKNGKIKIYPVEETDENKEKYYQKIINEMVDYQIEHNIDTKSLFDKYANIVNTKLNELKNELIQNDIEPYYGSIYYMVHRSIFIINCMKKILHESFDLTEIENVMLQYKKKYIDSINDPYGVYEYSDVNYEYYFDYDLIELYYKKILVKENELVPINVKLWKEYLTNPVENNDNYRYLMHCFSNGIVDPEFMNKACCSLYTPSIKNLLNSPKYNVGLIYDIDAESLDTMCTCDVGSWITNKEEFVSRECPCNWQLTKTSGDTIYYEYPLNSKLIMPIDFERDIKDKIKNGIFTYSEIFLNKNAKAIGVFYTEECLEIEDVELYAKKNNLPLIKIDLEKQKIK